MKDKIDENSLEVFISVIQREIDMIEMNISKLRERKNTLMLILHAKKEDLLKFKGKRVKRISKNRADISLIIKEYIFNSTSECKCSDIIVYIKEIGFSINDSTLRTYLSYMREDGIIKPGSKKGYWVKG